MFQRNYASLDKGGHGTTKIEIMGGGTSEVRPVSSKDLKGT